MVHVLGLRLAVSIGAEDIPLADGTPFVCEWLLRWPNDSLKLFYFLNRYCLLFALMGMYVVAILSMILSSNISYSVRLLWTSRGDSPASLLYERVLRFIHSSEINCQALYTFNQVCPLWRAYISSFLSSSKYSVRRECCHWSREHQSFATHVRVALLFDLYVAHCAFSMAVWSKKWYIVVALVSVIMGHWSLLLHGKRNLLHLRHSSTNKAIQESFWKRHGYPNKAASSPKQITKFSLSRSSIPWLSTFLSWCWPRTSFSIPLAVDHVWLNSSSTTAWSTLLLRQFFLISLRRSLIFLNICVVSWRILLPR